MNTIRVVENALTKNIERIWMLIYLNPLEPHKSTQIQTDGESEYVHPVSKHKFLLPSNHPQPAFSPTPAKSTQSALHTTPATHKTERGVVVPENNPRLVHNYLHTRPDLRFHQSSWICTVGNGMDAACVFPGRKEHPLKSGVRMSSQHRGREGGISRPRPTKRGWRQCCIAQWSMGGKQTLRGDATESSPTQHVLGRSWLPLPALSNIFRVSFLAGGGEAECASSSF